WFLSGAVFPVDVLPAPLRDLSQLYPLTHSLRGMRLALLRGAPFSELAEPIAALVLFCVLLLPASFYLFSLALRRARQNGSLSFY
ncbi:MAG: ABC transporter permease, partial [Terriglobales bacterium]